MTYAERVAELVAIVAAVDGAGLVHGRSRIAAKWKEFIDRFVDEDRRVNGWEITRRVGSPESPRWAETWRLTKYYGVKDEAASDHALQEHLDAVVRAFRPGDGAALTWGVMPQGLSIEVIEEAMFGDVLCHVARCQLVVQMSYATL